MCSCQVARKAAADKKRPSARARGYDSKWEKAKATFLAKPGNGTCRYCGGKANAVDHEIPHKGDMKIFWDTKRWIPSCVPCNSRKAAKHEGGFGNPRREYGES